MKSAFVLIALVHVVAASPMLGSDRCTWGPSYWCSQLSTAKECGAVKHCMDNVWGAKDKNEVADKSKDSLCDYCHTFIKDAQEMMESNETKAEIEQTLKQACALIPDKQFQDMCIQAVDQYAPDIIDMIAARMDPDTVCKAIGLCPTGKTVRHTKPAHKSPSVQFGADLCAECKTYVQQAKDILKDNTTEAEVEQFLDDNLCSRLGSMEDMCKQVVKAYAPMIFQMLSNDMDPEAVCKAIGLCKKAVTAAIQAAKLRPAIKPIGNFEECELCKLVIEEAKTKAGQKEVEALIEDKLCAKLGSLQNACKEVVETYAPEIFQMIGQDLDPDTVCRAIGFCKNATGTLTHKMTPVISRETTVKAGPQCALCEFVMKEVDRMLAKNATQAEIVKALDEVCSILPATLKDECTTFVNQYAPAIIILLANELDPKLVCSTLQLCATAEKKKVNDGTTCEVCELAMGYLDSMLAKNSTEQEIEKALEELCGYLPSTMSNECDALVSQYGKMIIELIAHGISPEQVCTELGLCSAVKKHLLGTKECTFGPSYWCASQENAKKCGAVQHCKDHVWEV